MTRLLRLALTLSGTFALRLVALDRVSAQDQFCDSNGVRIRDVDQGAGPPVVLLHGFGGSLESGWGETGVLPNLARDYPVFWVDSLPQELGVIREAWPITNWSRWQEYKPL